MKFIQILTFMKDKSKYYKQKLDDQALVMQLENSMATVWEVR